MTLHVLQAMHVITLYRCTYHYDALGNLYNKNCSDSTVFQYLIDPFGKYGADIVAEVCQQKR